MKLIDVNSDVGEGVGNEAQLMPLISSCNIACGGHAGDAETMAKTIKVAKRHGVKIGAHPSYPDTINFGRKAMAMAPAELIRCIRGQLKTFGTILQEHGGSMHHIKAHGALYNTIAKDKDVASTYLKALEPFYPVTLYVPHGSEIAILAFKLGWPLCFEAFADRNYNEDGTLVSRNLDNALLQNVNEVLQHVLNIVDKGHVKTVQKTKMAIKADTLCIHGDTPSAIEILTYLHHELPNHQIKIT